MHEFSLYTSYPLSEPYFNSLISKIEKMAMSLEPNVHILLSSFAVMDKQGKIINMSLFVEGGNLPKIHSFAKNTASSIDIDYQNPHQLFSQKATGFEPFHHAELVAGDEGQMINNGSTFEVITQGGARYTQTVDVCLDHYFGHSKALMTKRIYDGTSPDEIIPRQVEQCITSNTVYIENYSKIATTVLHADPRISMDCYNNVTLEEGCLSNNAKKRIIGTKYKQMQITPSDTGYDIISPPFGSNCRVDVIATRPAAQYIPKLRSAIENQNERVIRRYEERAGMTSKEDKVFNIIRKTNIIMQKVEQLENILLKKSRPTFWQKLFNTVEYKQKMQATSIIQNSFKLMKPILEENKAEQIFLVKPWKKDLIFRLNNLSPFKSESSFIKSLQRKIENIISIQLGQKMKSELEQDKSIIHHHQLR